MASYEDKEASIHDTDDEEDRIGTDSDDREVAAAWEDEGSDAECNGNKEVRRASFSRTAFNDSLKENSE